MCIRDSPNTVPITSPIPPPDEVEAPVFVVVLVVEDPVVAPPLVDVEVGGVVLVVGVFVGVVVVVLAPPRVVVVVVEVLLGPVVDVPVLEVTVLLVRVGRAVGEAGFLPDVFVVLVTTLVLATTFFVLVEV